MTLVPGESGDHRERHLAIPAVQLLVLLMLPQVEVQPLPELEPLSADDAMEVPIAAPDPSLSLLEHLDLIRDLSPVQAVND